MPVGPAKPEPDAGNEKAGAEADGKSEKESRPDWASGAAAARATRAERIVNRFILGAGSYLGAQEVQERVLCFTEA